MTKDEFLSAATYRARTNVTENVAFVTATFSEGRLNVVFYLRDCESEEDEEWRDQCVGELIADFPEIETAEDRAVVLGPNTSRPDPNHIVFNRQEVRAVS